VALEGPLKEFHIQDVFQLLDLGRKSGVLRVTSEMRQASGTISFEHGGVVSASLGRDSELLGARMVRLGKISEGDLAKARGQQEAGDSRRLGDILVADGAISRRELDRQLKGQIEDTIFQLLAWSEGYFRFEDGAPGEVIVESPVRIPTGALLMEAARRHDEWSKIAAKVPHLRVVPKLPPPDSAATGRLDLLPFEWEVLAAVDGERDLHTLANVLGRSEFDVARTIYALSAAGVVVVDNPARLPPSSANGRDSTAALLPARQALARGQYESAAKSLQDVLRTDPLMPEARRLFGVCQAALGRFRGAAETWRSWARLGTLSPVEEAMIPAMQQLEQAAETLAQELESYRD
jgi:hypothetical protein